MISLVIAVTFFWTMCEARGDFYYRSKNFTRTTPFGVQAYKSALTLDWQEGNKQMELADVFDTEATMSTRISTDCIGYARPASGKIARLVLEMLKSLEGDDGCGLIDNMVQALVRSRLLMETSMLDAEPDLDALVKTPGMMVGEPHITFPRILAMTWMTVTDSVTTKKYGWCPIQKLTKYLGIAKPEQIAHHMKTLEPILARVRFVMEEFILHVTPINMYEKTPVKREYGSRRRGAPDTPPSRTHLPRVAQVVMAHSPMPDKPCHPRVSNLEQEPPDSYNVKESSTSQLMSYTKKFLLTLTVLLHLLINF